MDEQEIIIEQEFKTLPGGLKLPNNPLNIFIGPNNSGKTNILLFINERFGGDTYYVSPQRFNVTNRMQVLENIENYFNQSRDSRKRKEGDVSEIPGPDPTAEIAALDKKSIELLFKWHKQYFAEIRIDEDENYPFRARQIFIDNQRPSDQGSGSRAVFALLVKLFDPRIKVICIDEPEISVEPKTQKKLFELIKAISLGAQDLPQKRVFIATHSHLFIDKETPKNNHKVYKLEGKTQIALVETEMELTEIVFDLLGNSPGDLFFPSNIIVVEGESDFIFLSKVISLFPDSIKRRGLRIHYADADNRIPGAVKSIDQMLKSVSYTPVYRNQLCVLFDKQDSSSTYTQQVKDFLQDEDDRVKELSKKGIEYYYPTSAMVKITKIAENELENSINQYLDNCDSSHEGIGKLGAFEGTKIDLAKAVSNEDWKLDEIDSILKELIQKALDLAYE